SFGCYAWGTRSAGPSTGVNSYDAAINAANQPTTYVAPATDTIYQGANVSQGSQNDAADKNYKAGLALIDRGEQMLPSQQGIALIGMGMKALEQSTQDSDSATKSGKTSAASVSEGGGDRANSLSATGKEFGGMKDVLLSPTGVQANEALKGIGGSMSAN